MQRLISQATGSVVAQSVQNNKTIVHSKSPLVRNVYHLLQRQKYLDLHLHWCHCCIDTQAAHMWP